MLPAAIVDLGFLTSLLGVASIAKPLAFLGIRTRPAGALLIVFGVLLILFGWSLPAKESRAASKRTRLDEIIPAWQFEEFHSIRVLTSPERAYAAIKGVTANEIFLFRTLTAIRRGCRAGPESILNAPGDQPLLDVATRSGFLLLAEEPGRELVVGTLVLAPRGWKPGRERTPEAFKQIRSPGFALAAMNFRIEESRPGECLVTTETRVFATDASSRRRFARYWRTIYPGSALIRRMWLRAVKKRAETVR